MYINLLLDINQFLHQFLIYMKTTGCIENYNVIAFFCSLGNCRFGNLPGLIIRTHVKNIDILLLTVNS